MTVITVSACPPGLRGDITKWMFEIDTGTYVAQLNARIRDALWDRICKNLKDGRAIMAYTTRTEQGFSFRTFHTEWQTVDFEGIELMKRPLPAEKAKEKKDDETSGKGKAECKRKSQNEKAEPQKQSVTGGNKAQLSAMDKAMQKVAGRAETGKRETEKAEPEKHEAGTIETERNVAGKAEPENTLAGQSEAGKVQVTIEPSGSSLTQTDAFEGIKNNHSKQTNSTRPKKTSANKISALPYVMWQEDQSLPADFVAIDLETTGLSSETDEIIEIGAVRFRNHQAVDEVEWLVHQNQPLRKEITDLTGISDDLLERRGVDREKALSAFLSYVRDDPIVVHYAKFDLFFLFKACESLRLNWPAFRVIDTRDLIRQRLPALPNAKLITAAQYFGVADVQSHRALADSKMTAEVYLKLKEIE